MTKLANLTCAIIAALVVPSWACAEDSALVWRDRGDRFEGIKPRPVDGERFDFVGIRVPTVLVPDAKTLYLTIPASCPIGKADRVDVREDGRYYWMSPKHEHLVPPPFRWQTTDVLRRAGVEFDKLRVTVRNEATGIYCPAVLSTSPGERPDRSARYVFTFSTPADVSLEWQVVALETGRKIAQGRVEGDRRGCEIEWVADNVRAGDYQLRVDGRGESIDGEFKIVKTVDFRLPEAWLN